MLVIPDSLDGLSTKGPGNKALTIEDAPQSLGPPPAYVPSPATSDATSSNESNHISAPIFSSAKWLHNATSSNYIFISRDWKPIKENFLINPFMTASRYFSLPSGANKTEDDRPNLKLHTLNALIDVHITLLSSTEGLSLDEEKHKKHTVVDLTSINGSTTAYLHTPAPASGILIPFQLNVAVTSGSATVGLPPGFEGLLKISVKNGSINPTSTISQCTVALSEEGGTQWRFIGNKASIVDGWKGNEVNIEVETGNVKVGFVIE